MNAVGSTEHKKKKNYKPTRSVPKRTSVPNCEFNTCRKTSNKFSIMKNSNTCCIDLFIRKGIYNPQVKLIELSSDTCLVAHSRLPQVQFLSPPRRNFGGQRPEVGTYSQSCLRTKRHCSLAAWRSIQRQIVVGGRGFTAARTACRRPRCCPLRSSWTCAG